MGQVYEKKYALNHFDFDKNHKLKPMTLMNFLQDISTIHFDACTSNIPESELPGIWVIVEWQVDFFVMPDAVMDLTVITEPIFFRKCISYRRYEFADDQGKPLGQAISKWAYIDPITRKQINIPHILNEVFEVEENCEKPGKIVFDDIEGMTLDEMTRTSVYSDIDTNRHVNNVTYIRWAIDALGSRLLDRYQLKSLKVFFKREVFEGVPVIVSTEVKETAHSAVSKQQIISPDQTVCVVVQIEGIELD